MSVSFAIVEWENNQVLLLDQRQLPTEERYVYCQSFQEVAEAICNMTVRGAPAIGVTAAFGLALAALQSQAESFSDFWRDIEKAAEVLFATRPTAVNLRWGLERIKAFIKDNQQLDLKTLKENIISEAINIKNEDVATNQKIGEYGQSLFNDGETVLTHCNAGALATSGFGTALGVIYAAKNAGKKIKVFADETRPFLQGSRLTAWELHKNGIETTVITDNMAAHVMKLGYIDKIIVGADRIASNGDVANKIGTYNLAILAKHHGIPFYVAAPFSTIDLTMENGKQIEIEERHENEVRKIGDKILVPNDVKVKNFAFDVTPSQLVTALITEKGICQQPLAESLKTLSKNA